MLFPVERPGESITADWELFFFLFPKNSFFSYQKGKKRKKNKDFAAARLDRKQTFFKGVTENEDI